MMTWHRSITHSIVMLPAWALLLAGLTTWLARRLRWPSPAFSTLFLIYVVGLASHIFLDVITSFGTMVWSPINYSRVSWDWVAIVDLSVTSLALVPQLGAWAFRRPERAVRRAVPLWAFLSASAFAIGPLVRTLGVPFPPTASVVAMGALAIFSFTVATRSWLATDARAVV